MGSDGRRGQPLDESQAIRRPASRVSESRPRDLEQYVDRAQERAPRGPIMPEPTTLRALSGLPSRPASLADSTLIMMATPACRAPPARGGFTKSSCTSASSPVSPPTTISATTRWPTQRHAAVAVDEAVGARLRPPSGPANTSQCRPGDLRPGVLGPKASSRTKDLADRVLDSVTLQPAEAGQNRFPAAHR